MAEHRATPSNGANPRLSRVSSLNGLRAGLSTSHCSTILTWRLCGRMTAAGHLGVLAAATANIAAAGPPLG